MHEVISDLLAFLGADVVKEAGKHLLKSITPGDMKYLRLRTTGTLPLEDENLVERAKAELNASDATATIVPRAEEKLSQLESHQQDYVRMIMVGIADPNAPRAEDERRRIDGAKGILTLYAEMTNDQWLDHVPIMNFDIEQTESRILDAFVAHPDDSIRQAAAQALAQLQVGVVYTDQLRQRARHGWQPTGAQLGRWGRVLLIIAVVFALVGLGLAGLAYGYHQIF